jgi:putative addiction module component (TIGR02574 family)
MDKKIKERGIKVMEKTFNDIRNDALALSASERASLAHDLILSLDDPEELELSPEQETEIMRRVQMVQEGQAVGRPVESVLADLHTQYGR